MTKKEANEILALLDVNYPDQFKDLSDDAYRVRVNLWASAFQAEPFNLVKAAVMAYVVNSPERFAPNIGQIKEHMRLLSHPDELTEAEAWAAVRAALRNSAYNATEEFAKLPPLVKRVIGSAAELKAYAMLEEADALTVFASNFQRGYRTAQSREAAMEKTPPAIREMFASLTSSMPDALPEPGTASTSLPAAPPLEGDERRRAIAAIRARSGDEAAIAFDQMKAAAIDKLRNYGKE